MFINDDLEYLHRVITGAKTGTVVDIGLFDRFFLLGIISMLNRINNNLEELNKQLDISPNLEALSIKFDTFLDEKYWMDNLLFSNKYAIYEASGVDYKEISFTNDINSMTNYLPPVEEGGFTQAQFESFKRAVHQLCDEQKTSYKSLQQGVLHGILDMTRLLCIIRHKVDHPADHQFIKIWNEIYEEYKDDECLKEYEDWKEELGVLTINDLIIRQKQEIFKLLCSNVFRYFRSPLGYQLRSCSIKINEDDLPVGTEIPSDIKIKAAIFDKLIEWKGKYILTMDYERLGKYLYRNYSKLTNNDFYAIVDFDMVLEAIHEDMASLKPNLSPYLKRYEEDKTKEILEDCTEILDTCQIHLAKGVQKTFLNFYLGRLLYDKEMKDEARKKLTGGSKNTYICEIIAALKNVHIFKPDCDKKDLANSLSKKIKNIKVDTISKNIERAYNANEGALLYWTQKNINDIKVKSNNPFKDIL
jgi:hypothetical protein